MVYAGILAAGIGERMHRQDLPKQFLPLGEKPIIIHTLEQFFINQCIEKIIVVAPEDWSPFTEDLIAKYDTMGKEVSVILGGINKTVSVKRIAEHIQSSTNVRDEDILVTHDAVRPFITQRIINDNIAAAIQYGAAVTVMTTNDTIIITNDGNTLTDVPPKSQMFAEQTPQTFNVKTLINVFDKAAEQKMNLAEETEIARLYIKQGYSARLVNGEYFNMKIINPYDLEVANALLKERAT